MERDQLVSLLSAIVDNQRIKGSGASHVNVPCLMAPWRHPTGQDRSPSMTISHGNGPSFVTCWACEYKKPFSDMMFELNVLRGGTLAKIALDAQKMEIAPHFKPLAYAPVAVAPPADCRESIEIIRALPWTKDAVAFIESKGVTLATAKSIGLGCIPAGTVLDLPDRDNDITVTTDTIVFPMEARIDGVLRYIGASARGLNTYGSKYYAILPFPSESYLYLEPQLTKVQGRVVAIVEGFFDAIHLVQEGIIAFGLFGTHLSSLKAKKLLTSKPAHVLNIMDPDKAGSSGRTHNENLLKSLGLSVTSPILEKDPKYYTKSQIQALVPNIEL